jgi:hypothetical protein
MSKGCRSRLGDTVAWLLKAPLINIPIFIIEIIVILEVVSKIDKYYFFVPVGKYAQIIEYILIVALGYFIARAYKKRNESVDECHYLRYLFSKIPYGKFIFDTLSFILVGYLLYYSFMLYIHTFNLPVKTKNVEVQILDISNRGRKHCKPLASTDFLKNYTIEYPTFFYLFVKKYAFDSICMHHKYLQKGQTVILEVKESPLGLYITGVREKIY